MGDSVIQSLIEKRNALGLRLSEMQFEDGDLRRDSQNLLYGVSTNLCIDTILYLKIDRYSFEVALNEIRSEHLLNFNEISVFDSNWVRRILRSAIIDSYSIFDSFVSDISSHLKLRKPNRSEASYVPLVDYVELNSNLEKEHMLDFFDLLRSIRNTQHNNGIHNNSNKKFDLFQISYEFKKGEPFRENSTDLGQAIIARADMIDQLSILVSKISHSVLDDFIPSTSKTSN